MDSFAIQRCSSSPPLHAYCQRTTHKGIEPMLRISWPALALLLAFSPGSSRAQGSGEDESAKSTATFGVHPGSMQPPEAMLTGSVSLTAADGRRFPAQGTRLT